MLTIQVQHNQFQPRKSFLKQPNFSEMVNCSPLVELESTASWLHVECSNCWATGMGHFVNVWVGSLALAIYIGLITVTVFPCCWLDSVLLVEAEWLKWSVNSAIIISDNGSPPDRCQANVWAIAGWTVLLVLILIVIIQPGPEFVHATITELTHWTRVTHICVSKITIISSDNGLSPGRRQAII